MKAKTFSVIFVALAVLSVSMQCTVAATTYASLSVSHSTVPSTIGPGESGNILLTISNSGTNYARSAELTMKANGDVSYGKTFFKIGTIAPSDSVQVTIPVEISSDAEDGALALSFAIKYFDGDASTSSTMENFISLQINKRAIVQVDDVYYDQSPIEPGSVVNMSISMENVGDSDISDLVASLDLEDLPIVQIKGDSQKYIGDIDNGNTAIAEFSLAIDKDADIMAYSIPLTLSYYDDSGTLHTDEKSVGIVVSGEIEFVIATESSNSVYNGYKTDMTISIANRGSAPAEALTVVIDSPEIYSNDGTAAMLNVIPESYYIGTLDADDFETLSISITLIGSKYGSYDMPIKLVYRDSYNMEYETDGIVELELSQISAEIPLWMQAVGFVFLVGLVYWKRKFIMGLFSKKRAKR